MKATITSVLAGGARETTESQALLSMTARDAARQAANAWIKRLRLVDYGGQPMRSRFRYRDDALWWFTELYLHKMRRLDAAIETIAALDALRERDAPAAIEISSADEAVRDAARAWSEARGLPVVVGGEPARRPDRAWQGYLIGLTARLSRWRPSAEVDVPARPTVAAFVHTAFWQQRAADGPGQESYIGPVLAALSTALPPESLACVGVGPRRNFRARRWWDPIATAGTGVPMVTPIEGLAPRRALDGSMSLWRRREALAAEITEGAAIRDAGVVDGVDLWPVLKRELEGVALLQWPWSARAMDEAGAALDRLSPGAVTTYAEAGGWGRALVLEARRRDIPSIGIQHGFIYRHWLNYLHEPDEMVTLDGDRGAPIPSRTLVFDRYAARHLETAGRFPSSTLAVTGSARLDELSARVASWTGDARLEVRHELGVADGETLLVLAAKHSEIAAELPALVNAVHATAGARLVIKPHPAETAEAYADATADATRVSVAPAGADLARLLAAADAVATMNSTVAIDALVLGIPALVVGLPNNLSPFVDAGVMIGAGSPPEVTAGVRTILYDAEARHALAGRAREFTAAHEMQSDGRAAARAAAEILAMTR